MTIFKPCKIVDPETGKERVISPEEQEEMLENGIYFDVPCTPVVNGDHPTEEPSNSLNQ